MNQESTVYFIYSPSQYNKNEKIAKAMNGVYTPIKVRVGGRFKEATDMVENINKINVSDYSIVISGKLKDMYYIKGGIK